MELLELMKHRRSIRKYQDAQISRTDLETIIEAGTYAPSAGGGLRSMIVGVHNASLAEKIGRMNLARFDRSKLAGSFVSKEQPSTIDDPTIKNGFYGAPAVCVVFAQKNFLYSMTSMAGRRHRGKTAPCRWQGAVLISLGVGCCFYLSGDCLELREGSISLKNSS